MFDNLFTGFLGSKPEFGVKGENKDPSGKNFFDFVTSDGFGNTIKMSAFKGKKAILVVNVASK